MRCKMMRPSLENKIGFVLLYHAVALCCAVLHVIPEKMRKNIRLYAFSERIEDKMNDRKKEIEYEVRK